MKKHFSTGINFGLTSGVITTLGLIVGLHAGTNSVLAVIGGIVTIAIADAMSDALGIHVVKEAENVFTPREVWLATISTFLTKFFMAITFVVPLVLFELNYAIIVSVIWGLSVLTLLSYSMARSQNANVVSVCGEHLMIAVAVIVITHYVGDLVAVMFGS